MRYVGLKSSGADLATQSDISSSGGGGATSDFSHQNLLYNATFQVNQRASASGTFAAGAYTVDRWKAGASGCTLTIPTSAPLRTLTITAGTLLQIIPAEDLEQGKQYVLSWKGTAQARIGTGVYSTSPITLTQGTANLQIEFTTGTISEPMLNSGTIAGFYEPEPYQINLTRCARFFLAYSGKGAGNNPWATLVFIRSYDAYGAVWTAPTPTAMRSVPTVTTAGRLFLFFSGVAAGAEYTLSFVCYSVGPSSIEGNVYWPPALTANANGIVRGNGNTGANTVTPVMYFNSEL